MKFSVIIPIYNKADTIADAIASVYSQTIDDYEIVAVDDGSKDALIEALADLRSPKLRLIHQENGGVSVARNTGLSYAKGEYICFLDADDLWKPNHLEVLHNLIEKYPDAHAFVTSHEIVTPDGEVIHSSESLRGYKDDFETDDFLGLLNKTSYSVVHTNSVCAKREMMMLEGIRFEPGVRIGEDTDVWYRLGLKYKMAISKAETTVYRREYSTATKKSFHIQNWIFCTREATILSDSKISDDVKASLIHLIDRYKMTCSREYMLEGNRKEAKKVLFEVKNKKGIRYIFTRLLTFLPIFLCRLILSR